jgi:trigger factor
VQLDIKDAGPCKKTLEFVIPASEVDQQFEDKYTEISQKVPFPGFRPGKAPRVLIEKRLGKEIAKEVTTEMIQKRFKEALEDHDLTPLGQPDFDLPEEPAAEGADFAFSVSFEIYPEIEIGTYEGLSVEDPFEPASDEDVQEVATVMRRRMARQEKLAEGQAIEGDIVATLKLELHTDDGAEIYSTGRQQFWLEEPRIPGLEAPQLGEDLVGKQAGDTGEVTVTLPDDYLREEFRGKTATIRYEILGAERRILPTDEQVLEESGQESLEKLHDAIRQSLDDARRDQANRAIEDKLVEQLLETHTFDLPQDILAASARQSYEEAHGPGDPDPEDEVWQSTLRQTEEEFRRQVLLETIADDALIAVSESDVERQLSAVAMQQGLPLNVLRQEYQKRGLLSGFRAEIKHRKTLRHLRETAAIT